jgi:hypothetical protein
VSTTDIVPVGKDSYLISGRANGGLNAGKGTLQATQKANAYCATQHKFMIIRRVDTNGNAAVFGESAVSIPVTPSFEASACIVTSRTKVTPGDRR